MEERLDELKSELDVLKQAQLDNDSSGSLKRMKIGDKDMTFFDITERIRDIRNSISLLEINLAR